MQGNSLDSINNGLKEVRELTKRINELDTIIRNTSVDVKVIKERLKEIETRLKNELGRIILSKNNN